MAHYQQQGEWRHQADLRIDQAAPVNGTWYEILPATGRYTHLIMVSLAVLVANETLEIEVLVDGIIKTGAFACVAGIGYVVRHFADPAPGSLPLQIITPTVTGTAVTLDIIGHDIRVRVRKTTALGAGNLRGKVTHAVQ